MQRCKYLDDLGLKIEEYGTKEREEYGFDVRETWNLDNTFVEWIYTRVLMYKERNCVDTSFHKVSYKDSSITQEEAMDMILSLSKQILLDMDNDELRLKNFREICDLWKEILPLMWW